MIKQTFFASALLLLLGSCTSIRTDHSNDTTQEVMIDKTSAQNLPSFQFSFTNGKEHNYPTFAIWIENAEGELIQTLFVTKSIASGYFRYGDAGDGKWLKVPGKAQRPAALPYWLHKREVVYNDQTHLPTVDQPFPDAFTGATPASAFQLKVQATKKLPEVFYVMAEVNQPWDWNDFWTNDKYPGNSNYRTSAQPSIIYGVRINQNDLSDKYYLNPIGHGHPSGDNGKLFTDLNGFSTALDIFSNIQLQFYPISKSNQP